MSTMPIHTWTSLLRLYRSTETVISSASCSSQYTKPWSYPTISVRIPFRHDARTKVHCVLELTFCLTLDILSTSHDSHSHFNSTTVLPNLYRELHGDLFDISMVYQYHYSHDYRVCYVLDDNDLGYATCLHYTKHDLGYATSLHYLY